MLQTTVNPLDRINSLKLVGKNDVEIDTTKFMIPVDIIKSFDGNVFEDVVVYDKYSCKPRTSNLVLPPTLLEKHLGFNQCYVVGNNMVIEVSSKILANENSLSLINKNNVEDVFNVINSTDCFELDPQEAYEKAQVLKVDVTRDKVMKTDPRDYIFSLELISPNISDKFKVETYKHGGLVFRSTRKTVKDRLTVYPKYIELMNSRNMINAMVRDRLKPEVLESFKQVVRSEYNLKDFNGMRRAFDINKKEIMLRDVLEANKNPIHGIFSQLTKGVEIF